jgi:hypothetical protein
LLPIDATRVFGTELRYVRSDSSSSSPGISSGHAYHGRQTSTTYAERVAPALAPTELDALPASAVIVLAQADRQYRVLAERLNPIPKLASLRPPPLGRRVQSQQPARVTPEASGPSRTLLQESVGPESMTSVPPPTVDDSTGPRGAGAALSARSADGSDAYF